MNPVEMVFAPATVLPRLGSSVSKKNVTLGVSWPPARNRTRRMKRFFW